MKYAISLLGHFFLNPILFIYFSFVAPTLSDGIYIKVENTTNVYQLNMGFYFTFTLIVAAIVYALFFLYNKFSKYPLHLKEIAQTKFFYLQLLGYGSTALTLSVYSEGMEGNIMGFIFFPMVLLGSLCLSLPYIKMFFTHFQIGKEPIELELKLRFLIHLFNPFVINALTSVPLDPLANEGTGMKIFMVLLTIAIEYGVFLGVHWLIFKAFGKSFTVSQFFGEKEYLQYWIPYIGGFYLFIRNMILVDQKWFQEFGQYINLIHYPVFMFAMILAFANYFSYLKKYLVQGENAPA